MKYHNPYQFSNFGLVGYLILVIYLLFINYIYKKNNYKLMISNIYLSIYIIIILFLVFCLQTTITYANEGWWIILIICLVSEFLHFIVNKIINYRKNKYVYTIKTNHGINKFLEGVFLFVKKLIYF